MVKNLVIFLVVVLVAAGVSYGVAKNVSGPVVPVGGICDGSEPATNLCNVNAYSLTTDSTLTSGGNLSVAGDGSLDDASATTTLAVGGTNNGRLCLYNGSNYSILYFGDNSATVSTATSTTCQ